MKLFTAQADTVDLLRVVGADGWPKRRLYTERAKRLVHAFADAQAYDAHDLAIVQPALLELLHEEVAAHPTSWRRVFPPSPATHTPSGARAPTSASGSDVGLGGFVTDLDEATREFLAWREQSSAAQRILDDE